MDLILVTSETRKEAYSRKIQGWEFTPYIRTCTTDLICQTTIIASAYNFELEKILKIKTEIRWKIKRYIALINVRFTIILCI